MIVLHIRARDVDALMDQGYDTIRVYRDTSSSGSFNNLVGTISPLVTGQEVYDFVDSTGDLTSYYEFTYYKSANNSESSKSVAFTPGPTTGPLDILTIDYVRNTTDIPAISNLPASKVGEYIVRSETELINYTNRYGGLNTAAANYSSTMPLVARLLLEEIFLSSRPSARTRRANGLASERIGSYSYTTRAPTTDATYWTDEIINLLNPFLLGRRQDTTIKTTRVFHETHGVEKSAGITIGHVSKFFESDWPRNNVWADLIFGPYGQPFTIAVPEILGERFDV